MAQNPWSRTIETSLGISQAPCPNPASLHPCSTPNTGAPDEASMGVNLPLEIVNLCHEVRVRPFRYMFMAYSSHGCRKFNQYSNDLFELTTAVHGIGFNMFTCGRLKQRLQIASSKKFGHTCKQSCLSCIHLWKTSLLA